MSSKRVKELLAQVQPMAEQPGISTMLTLLSALIEDWKNELVEAKDQSSVLKLQGAITSTQQIIISIKRQPITNDYRNGAYGN